MNEHVKDVFSRMLGTKELPEKLVELYEKTKLLNDRVAPGPMPVSTYAILAILSGAAKTADRNAEPAKVKWDDVKKHTPVIAFWEGTARTGEFLSQCGTKNPRMLRIRLDGDKENLREIPEGDVKLKEN